MRAVGVHTRKVYRSPPLSPFLHNSTTSLLDIQLSIVLFTSFPPLSVHRYCRVRASTLLCTKFIPASLHRDECLWERHSQGTVIC